MPDTYTEVTKKGWGSRIGSSFKGIFVGIILFIISFGILYWNEGRMDMSKVAEDAVQISSTEQSDASLEGKLISTAGKLTTSETLGDGLYLSPGKYTSLTRSVEMYAWVEKTESKSKVNYGGSETTETTYNYVKEWTSTPANSSNFKIPEDHENPTMSIEGKNFKVSTAKVGNYNINPSELSFPSSFEVNLDGNVIRSGDVSVEGNYIYKRVGYSDTPIVGDIRISYTATRPDIDVTAFGKLQGDKIIGFTDKNGSNLYRLFSGTSPEAAVAQMHKEHTTMGWILRLVGFLLMWAGLSMIMGPLSILLDVLPFLGSISRGLVKIVTGIVAFVLSLVTIIISMIFHSILALIIAVVAVLFAVVFILKRKAGSVEKKVE